MRLLLATLSSIALAGIAYGQIVSSPEQVIRRMIESGSLEGHDRKVIGGMGDAAAVTVTKVLAGRNLSANDIDSVLVILNSSSLIYVSSRSFPIGNQGQTCSSCTLWTLPPRIRN